MPPRFMLDNMVVDRLMDDQPLAGAAGDLQATGSVDLLITHVQLDELAKTPNVERRGRLVMTVLRSCARIVPTEGFVLGDEPDPSRPAHRQAFAGSRLGLAKLTDEATAALLDRYADSNPAEWEDALIAVTAHAEGAIIVTDDDALRRRARRLLPQLDVWNVNRFAQYVSHQHRAPSGVWPAAEPAARPDRGGFRRGPHR